MSERDEREAKQVLVGRPEFFIANKMKIKIVTINCIDAANELDDLNRFLAGKVTIQ